ncbi:MAG: TetR/AcrR family transcriptional regulator [Elusimicrobia bacterium]|nr:TetR/AcrR family transcriptional regulator [Elusimicrobiota bacterium]
MTRPTGDSARKLLEAGRALALARGFGGVTVREVCRRAKVNLGLFHYHFKTREAFVSRLLDEGYGDFFARLSGSAEGGGSPPERLRRALASIARFTRENRRLCIGMLRDGMNGERRVAAFAAKAFPHHMPLVLAIYEEGVRRGDFRRLPVPLFLSVCMGAMNGPNIMLTLLEDHGARRPFGRALGGVAQDLLSDAALEERVDMILAALARPRRKE